MTIERANRLSLDELDRCCIGVGIICVHCHRRMPEPGDAPRPCTEINSKSEIRRLEEKMTDASS